MHYVIPKTCYISRYQKYTILPPFNWIKEKSKNQQNTMALDENKYMSPYFCLNQGSHMWRHHNTCRSCHDVSRMCGNHLTIIKCVVHNEHLSSNDDRGAPLPIYWTLKLGVSVYFAPYYLWYGNVRYEKSIPLCRIYDLYNAVNAVVRWTRTAKFNGDQWYLQLIPHIGMNIILVH